MGINLQKYLKHNKSKRKQVNEKLQQKEKKHQTCLQ